MKQLIRRLSRVSDSSHYSLLHRSPTTTNNSNSFRRTAVKISSSLRFNNNVVVGVPEGHLPVYVGDEMERFVVKADLLSHPIFVKLLNKSAQEYGYEQPGVLRIPCHVFVFERVLEAVRVGGGRDVDDEDDLIESFADELL